MVTLRKGEQTRSAIIAAALELASRDGLEGLTIGTLADQMGMSKSGVFAHFGSREDLQIAVVWMYHQRFADEVFVLSLQQVRGLPRLRSMFEHWVRRVATETSMGCIYVSGAVEYDDRPSAVRDALVEMVCKWHEALERCVHQAIEVGHLSEQTDPEQLVFEMHGLVLATHHDVRFLKKPGSIDRAHAGFERLLDTCRSK